MRSRLRWAGHVERMGDDRLPKRAAELREEGRMRLGRPRLRWEDCVKIDVRKAGEADDWKKKTRDRRRWKILSDEEVKKLTKGKEEERDSYSDYCRVAPLYNVPPLAQIYYIKLQCPFVCLSVPPPFFLDTTVGPQPNLAHIFG